MFKRFLFMIFILVFSFNLFAQESEEMITVNKSDLPSNLVQKIETEKKIEKVGKYAGIGREIGVGVRECLGALTDEAEKFSNTKVGKFTLAMVAFKILGTDAIQLFIGIIVGFIGVAVYIFYLIVYCIPKKNVSTWTYTNGNTEVKEYYDKEYYDNRMFSGIVTFVLYMMICMAIIFA